MTESTPRNPTLSDLPPELSDHIIEYLPTASAIANLGRTSKSLHAYVEKDAWKTFARSRFPTTCPTESPSYKDTARTLTTLSRAWDRRAFVARYVEPNGDITAYPGGKTLDRWKRPRGQTIGFTPQLDVYESREREETLAFSAGAEICIRNTKRFKGQEDARWTSYRAHSAREGRDDITSLHLVQPTTEPMQTRHNVVIGTANGDLQLLGIPKSSSSSPSVGITYFATQGLPVRSSSISQAREGTSLLAANLGDVKIALYEVGLAEDKICPSSEIEVKPFLRADGNPVPHHRAWSTTFLSPTTLSIGVGPSQSPVHVYHISQSGLLQTPLRKFGLNHENAKLSLVSSSSAVYTTVALPSAIGSSGNGDVFLSGAYDGVIRLHDMRSAREVEQAYIDPADDSAIYSILPRGQEKLLAGTARHNLLKVFDLRLGAKCYNYQHADDGEAGKQPDNDYNIFLRPNNQSFTARGSNWSQGRNRPAESSVYSLASSSLHSPYVYAGVENNIWSLAFTEVLDKFPDPVYFEPWSTKSESMVHPSSRAFQSKDVLGLAMYDQDASMKLCVQRSLWETWRACAPRRRETRSKLDERWKGANEFGP